MTNLEKMTRVFKKLGCDVRCAYDESFIDVSFEMTTNRTTHGFSATFESNPWNNWVDAEVVEVDLNDIDWEEELFNAFRFEEELDYIEEEFCKYYMEDLLEWKSFGSGNLQSIINNWDDEKNYIKTDFEEFCTNFERLIEKYSEVK